MPEIIIPGAVGNTPNRTDAASAIAQHVGSFGASNTPADIKRVLEWFVDEGCVMSLRTDGAGKVHETHACYSDGSAMQFYGAIVDVSASLLHGFVKYDLHLHAATPYVHLELLLKNPLESASMMRRHLRRAYECLVHAGISRLTLEAGLSGGPTYWANAGADFQGGRALLNHIHVLAAFLGDCELADVGQLDTPGDVRQFNLAAEVSIAEAFKCSQLLSSIEGTGQTWVAAGQLDHKRDTLMLDIDTPRSVGEAILFAIGPWNGVFDLSEPGVSDARFRRFLGLA